MPIVKIKRTIENKLLSSKNRKIQYYGAYTITFAVMAVMVFSWFIFSRRTLIFNEDGWHQHYKALIYWGDALRQFFRELFINHQVVVQNWDFALGEGSDVLQALHYYVIGDPFALGAVFVSSKYMWIYYDLMIILRLYLAGIAFSELCFYTRKNASRIAILAASISYVFCYWGIFCAARHPYFLNPMIYFPLLILGFEKIIKREKPYLFIVSVFLSAISNFYFFYVLVALVVIYAFVRLITLYGRNIKNTVNVLLKTLGYAIIGVALGGIIICPVIYDFLSDTRMGSNNTWRFVYPLSYYSDLPGSILSGNGDYWLCMGLSAPLVVAMILLFYQKKKNVMLKVLFAICVVFTLIPVFGQVLNGMSYMSNKWSWALALLCSYVFVVMWDDMMNINPKESLIVLIALGIWMLLLLFLEYSRTIAAFSCLVVALIYLVLISVDFTNIKMSSRSSLSKPVSAVALVLVGILFVSFYCNDHTQGNYVNKVIPVSEVGYHMWDTDAYAVKLVADETDNFDEFYRYTGIGKNNRQFFNTGLMYGISSTCYYWSLTNPYINEYKHELELLDSVVPHRSIGYDNSSALLALNSVRYCAINASDKLSAPYGFDYVETINVQEDQDKELNYAVYRNENWLPLAYTYSNVISEDEWETLTAIQKQEAMLQAVVLHNYDNDVFESDIEFSDETLDYSINCDSRHITLQDNNFVVTSKNQTATLTFSGLENCETYFVIHGLDFVNTPTMDLYTGNEDVDPMDLYTEEAWNAMDLLLRNDYKKAKLFWINDNYVGLRLQSSSTDAVTLAYYTEEYSRYIDQHDFTVNLGYSSEGITSLTITFPNVGVYSFDSIDIVCIPVDELSQNVSKLTEDKFENVCFSTDCIEGSITLNESKVLLFDIPYSIGWTAYVDGEKVDIYRANIKSLGIVLDPGTHSIRLVYSTPYLKTGAAVTFVGFLALCGTIVVGTTKNRKSKINA